MTEITVKHRRAIGRRNSTLTGSWNGVSVGLNARGPSAKQRGVQVSLPKLKFMEDDECPTQTDGKNR